MLANTGARARQLIERLLTVHPKGYDLTLDRIVRLMDRLGNPQDSIPPVFHVAGSNGKGSTIAFLRAILEAAGKSVHVHTSPHLVDWRERYRIGKPGGGLLVDDDALADAVARAETANAGEPITVFELLTAAMFILFAEHPADFCIVEVGLGGRFDATNLVAHPFACCITGIGLDHQLQLGDTLEKIAFEKAGILKRASPAAIARQPEAARSLFERVCRERGVPAVFAGTDFDCHAQGGRFVFQDGDGLLDLPQPRLFGFHQLDNAATAIAILRKTLPDLPEDAYAEGMRTVRWPGRMELLRSGKLHDSAPKDAEIWIDGGHNPAGAAVVATALADLEERNPKPLVLVAGMLTTKDAAGFLAAFRGLANHVYTVPVSDSDSGFDAGELATIAAGAGFAATPAKSLSDALGEIKKRTGEPVRIIVCGSLYLIGEVLRENGTPPN